MTPRERTMPIIEAVRSEKGTWTIWLPGGFIRVAQTKRGVARIVNREVPGSAVRFSEWDGAPAR